MSEDALANYLTEMSSDDVHDPESMEYLLSCESMSFLDALFRFPY